LNYEIIDNHDHTYNNHYPAKMNTSLYSPDGCNTLAYVRCTIESGVDINKGYGHFKETLLHIAVHNDKMDIVKYLLTNGADINARDNVNYTPLVEAARRPIPNMDMVKYLLDNGADPKSIEVKNCNVVTRNHDLIEYIRSYDHDPVPTKGVHTGD